jgi:hypothetical protein
VAVKNEELIMATIRGIEKSPVFRSDRSLLKRRIAYNFCDYGFEIKTGLSEVFDIVPTRLDDEEAFIFFFSREDIHNGTWALFNLHVFLKYQGTLDEFAHSRGESVKKIALVPMIAFGMAAIGYNREIKMSELFKGGEPIISFIGGDPDRVVRDSHFYFMHHHRHCYTGVLHLPDNDVRYDFLRAELFRGIRFAG